MALLHAKDCSTLQRALVTIGNGAAFTANQDSLREAGCILRLEHMVIHPERSVKLAALLVFFFLFWSGFVHKIQLYSLQALANMSLNTANQKQMEHIVPLVISQLETLEAAQFNDEELTHQVLATLTNIAALTDWHHHFISSLPK